MIKRIASLLLALTLIIVSVSALADTSGTTSGNGTDAGQSPVLSVTLNNMNQVTAVSPILSVPLNNMNQVSEIGTSFRQSPTLSVTLNKLNRFSATIKGYGISLAGLFTIEDMLTKDARTEFDEIAAFVKKGQAVIDYFGTDISALILNGNLSSKYLGFDFSQLILSEYVSLGIHNEQELNNDIYATFGFASEYHDGQTVIIMFGYQETNGDIVWSALNAVAVDGQLEVYIPVELILRAGSEAILGILS